MGRLVEEAGDVGRAVAQRRSGQAALLGVFVLDGGVDGDQAADVFFNGELGDVAIGAVVHIG